MKNKILNSISSPLGFYVLSLLVVEGFLGIVLTQSNLSEQHQFTGLLIGVGLFVLVLIIVSLFTWLSPAHLTYNSTCHLLQSGKFPLYADSEGISSFDKLLSEDLSQQKNLPPPPPPPPPPPSPPPIS